MPRGAGRSASGGTKASLFFELGPPTRPVPYWRNRPMNKGIPPAKEYMPCRAETHVLETNDNGSNGNLFSAAF